LKPAPQLSDFLYRQTDLAEVPTPFEVALDRSGAYAKGSTLPTTTWNFFAWPSFVQLF
jgi:hypothetical protein